jgi:hypothetical protein
MGLASWALLVAGIPLLRIVFIGCIGALFELGACILAFAFLKGVIKHAEAADSRLSGLGLLGLAVGMGILVKFAWETVDQFVRGVGSLTASDPGWENPAWLELAAWGVGGALLVAGGLRGLGVKNMAWLASAFVASAGTLPIVLGLCSAIGRGALHGRA